MENFSLGLNYLGKSALALVFAAGISTSAFAMEHEKPVMEHKTITAPQMAEFKDADCTKVDAAKVKECEMVKEHLKTEMKHETKKPM